MTSISDQTSAPPRLHFSLAPEPSRLLRARERIRDYLTAHCADQTAVNDVVLAVEEACTNAIRHSGSTKDIDVRLGFSADELRVTIKDEGRGFDVESFDSHRLPDPLLDHGRGLYLIFCLCDELRLRRDGGLEVRMVKRDVLTSAEAAGFDRALVVEPGRAAGERLRAMLDEIDEGFVALDWEYRFTHVNTAACRLLGHTSDELLGGAPLELWGELVGSDLERAARQAMELGRSSIVEYETGDGEWLEARFYPTTVGLSVYFRNIDERKRRELERDELLEALGANQAMLERSQELAHLGSWELDLRSGRLAWSDEVYRIFGLAPQEFGATYEAFLEHVHPDDRAAVDAAYSGSLSEDRDSYEIEHRVVREHTGEIRFVHERCEHLRDAAGKIVRSLGMIHDITERKRSEEALQESERRQRFALKHAPAAIYEIDFRPPAPRFVSVNDFMCTYSGYSREELLAMSPFALLDDEGQALFRSRITAAVAGEPMPAEVEYRIRTKGGEERIAALHVTPIFEGGKPARGFVVAHDVTKHRLNEEALRRSEERYRSIVELASERLALESSGSLAFDAAASKDTAERVAPSGTHRIRHRLLETTLSQRRHPSRTTLIALLLELAYLVPLGISTTRSILGVPGSLLVLTVIVVGAIAGTWPGVVAALGGAAIFYFTVSGRGRDSSPLAVLISAGIWVTATVLASILADALLEQSARRREAAVAFVQAETARREQSAELRNAQRIATALQENLMHSLPTLGGLELGRVAKTAQAPELVGGDFSDVFVLDDGQVAILIGDVAGKGVQAAGLTETVRSTVRAFAAIDGAPSFVLEKTNELLLRHDSDGPHVTAFYCLLDLSTGHLAYASAGHPAPIHLGPRLCSPLAVRFGPPLGSFEGGYEAANATLTLDDYLVLYTDGVTEARRAGEMYGERLLVEVTAKLWGRSAQELAEGLVADVGGYAGKLTDDIEVVALRLA